MHSLTKKLTLGGGGVFIFKPWNSIEIFYETEIIQFGAITTEWAYPRKHCWKRFL